jgi:hypothetical protein
MHKGAEQNALPLCLLRTGENPNPNPKPPQNLKITPKYNLTK